MLYHRLSSNWLAAFLWIIPQRRGGKRRTCVKTLTSRDTWRTINDSDGQKKLGECEPSCHNGEPIETTKFARFQLCTSPGRRPFWLVASKEKKKPFRSLRTTFPPPALIELIEADARKPTCIYRHISVAPLSYCLRTAFLIPINPAGRIQQPLFLF